MVYDRFAFDGEDLRQPEDSTNLHVLKAALAGTYSTNWARLKSAVHSSTWSCLVNMANHLLPTAAEVVKKNIQRGERAFLLSLNHSTLVGGPALGGVILAAFAQESFIRLGYQVAKELRLQRGRRSRALKLEEVLIRSATDFDKMSFAHRCKTLMKELRISSSIKTIQSSFDLMEFRNSIAHDSPVLYLSTGTEVVPIKGEARPRKNLIGSFSTLESYACPVRLKHLKAAIDAHDTLVMFCINQSMLPGWTDAMREFEGGIGLGIKDAFKGHPWYAPLRDLSRTWEKEYQNQTDASLEDFIEMRNALSRRAGMRKSI